MAQSTTKFLISSSRRTGSHMLASALNEHPDLEVAGEVMFRPSHFGLAETDIIEDVDGLLCKTYEEFNGCIIHRFHMEKAYAFFKGHGHLRIIFLTRQNWLAALVSDRIAAETNIWHMVAAGKDYLSNDGTTKEESRYQQMSIPISECSEFLKTQSSEELMALEKFHGHRILFVSYEEMLSQWEETIRRICDFLNVAPQQLTPATLKQEKRKLSDIVLNFQEICSAFEHSRWPVMQIE